MFDKFQARRELARAQGSDASAYAWWYWQHNHYARYKRFIESMSKKLLCQDCGGAGGYEENVLGWGRGPWYDCDWCEGTGYVTPWIRGQWLRMRRDKCA